MLGMELTVPGKQLVLDAMAEGLLINCTHETCCASCRRIS